MHNHPHTPDFGFALPPFVCRRSDAVPPPDASDRRHSLSVEAYLIMPIQRVPRYNLLLGDLVRNTPPQHPDAQALRSAHEQMSSVGDRLNLAIQESASQSVGADVVNDAVLKYMAPSRKLIKGGSGFMLKVDKGFRGRKIRCDMYLFNDGLLLLMQKTLSLKNKRPTDEIFWPLHLIWTKK